ncbi:MAG: hypothetical protein PUC49_00780 [Clostridiales bacterium]|nr:hypothetical protein [Clostridiales bacterium]
MKDYMNLSKVVCEVCKVAKSNGKEITNIDKVRSKYLEIFEMLDIDRELLKEGTDYCLPKYSLDFLVDLYWFYSDAEVKKMRKGMFDAASIESVEKLLVGFTELINGLNISRTQKDDMISKMFLRTKYPYLLKRNELLCELKEMELDFVPDYKNDYKVEELLKKQIKEDGRPDFHNLAEIHVQKRFRYFDNFDLMDVNDEVVFTTYVLNDFKAMLDKHREIYTKFTEIRQCEMDDEIDQKVANMTRQDDIDVIDDFNFSVALQEELDKNDEYNNLLEERTKILQSNEFVKKVQPRFTAICERLDEINKETQLQLWGEIVLRDNDAVVDYNFRKPSMQVFLKALEEFQDDNKRSREYWRQRELITEEEKERTREIIEKIMEEFGKKSE